MPPAKRRKIPHYKNVAPKGMLTWAQVEGQGRRVKSGERPVALLTTLGVNRESLTGLFTLDQTEPAVPAD